MKRSIGVTLAAVISLAGSVIVLLLVLLATVAALLSPGDPSMPVQTRVATMVGCGVLFLFSAWGIATAVGLLRLCAWARWSILSFSVILAFFCTSTKAPILVSSPMSQP